MTAETTICVAGASGLVGSNIVRAALQRGYAVNGTLRDKDAPEKACYLTALPGAEKLSLFSAEMSDEASFVAPLAGADGVFIACLIPTYKGSDGTPAKEMDDARGYAEIIMPTVDGCLNILRAAYQQGVRTAVICSSTSSTNPVPPVSVKTRSNTGLMRMSNAGRKNIHPQPRPLWRRQPSNFAPNTQCAFP